MTTWNLIGNIKGAKGDTGASGPKGDTGDAGAKGDTGQAGPNLVDTSTSTSLTGLLKGNGSTVATITDNSSTWNNAVPNTRTVNGHVLTADVTVTKADVGLNNVDNTSDVNKPVSSAGQSALDLKANISGQIFTGEVSAPTVKAASENIQLGVSDPFLRGQIWNKMPNSILRLGSLASDGDPTSETSEGEVVYGQNQFTDPMTAGEFGYARIKSNRFGLYTSRLNPAGYVGYIWRVDPSEQYFINDAGTKTVAISRATGNITITGNFSGLNLSGTNTGDQTSTTVPNASTVPGSSVTAALNYIDTNAGGPHTRTYRYTVINADSMGGPYVSLGQWMYWNSNFIKVYKVVSGVRYLINFVHMTGVDSLDRTRTRFKNGLNDSSNQSYLINIIAFNPMDISPDDTVEIDYTECKNLNYRVNLIPQGWDFQHSKIYEGAGTDWTDFTGTIPELWSKGIPVSAFDGNTTLKEVGSFVAYRTYTPGYLPCKYLHGSVRHEIRFLVPNVLVDTLSPLNFDYSSDNIIIEMFELPRNRRKNQDLRSMPMSKYNFMGHFTRNLMEVMRSLSIGSRNSYAQIGFRLRNTATNSVGEWLPIRLLMRSGWRPNKTIEFSDNRKTAILIRFEIG
jgi:hypothetical protein